MRKVGLPYSDGTLSYTFMVAYQLGGFLHSARSVSLAIDTIHLYGTMLPNAVPVNGSPVVFQTICDHNF